MKNRIIKGELNGEGALKGTRCFFHDSLIMYIQVVENKSELSLVFFVNKFEKIAIYHYFRSTKDSILIKFGDNTLSMF